MKFKYNLCVIVIQNGWVTLSPFHVLVFYKIDKGEFKYNLCVSVIQNGRVTFSPFHVLVFYKIDG